MSAQVTVAMMDNLHALLKPQFDAQRAAFQRGCWLARQASPCRLPTFERLRTGAEQDAFRAGHEHTRRAGFFGRGAR